MKNYSIELSCFGLFGCANGKEESHEAKRNGTIMDWLQFLDSSLPTERLQKLVVDTMDNVVRGYLKMNILG